jgi:hypothetical protein
VGDNTLHLPWKSVATGMTDRLYATPAAPGITFSWQSGMPVSATAGPEEYSLFAAAPPTGEDNLLALCPSDDEAQPTLAAAVRVKSYPLTRHRVVVVPVGTSNPGFTAQQLQATLNTIYAQAVVEWEVTIDKALPATGLNLEITVPSNDYPSICSLRLGWNEFFAKFHP